MGLINIPGGGLTPEQELLLGTGQKAVLATTIKAYASLANNQTLTVYESNAGTPTAVTFEIEKSASGWTPTGGVVVVIDCTSAGTLAEVLALVVTALNARANRAYVWAVNGTSDGLVGSAISYGSKWNLPTSGTMTTANTVTTYGQDPLASSIPTDVFVANDYDPQISGLALSLPIGTRAFTYDGTKWWRKYESGITTWVPEYGEGKSTLGANGTTLTTGAILDTKSKWKVTVQFRGTGGSGNIIGECRLNGANTNMLTNAIFVSGSTATANQNANARIVEGGGIAQGTIDFFLDDLSQDLNTWRFIRFELTGVTIGGVPLYQSGNVSLNGSDTKVITSFTLEATTNQFLAGSTIEWKRNGRR